PAITERDLAGLGIDMFGARAQVQGHPLVSRLGAQQLGLGLGVFEVSLGQRGAVIRQMSVGAYQGGAGSKPGLGEAGTKLRGGMAASHDDDTLHEARSQRGKKNTPYL